MFKSARLTPQELAIIRDRGTEAPFSAELSHAPGSYLCRQCGQALFRAAMQFPSGCGWLSFDNEINGAITRMADGSRTEITCARCRAHLGHVFLGEGFTLNNLRHCVNSLSIEWIADLAIQDTEEAIVAAGCFWGVEYLFKQLAGVLKTEVGYIGGHNDDPCYQDVCSGTTHHVEAIRILYDPHSIDYDAILRYFFEIHDPTQTDGQGPDRGEQYQSVVFYYDEAQQRVAQHLIHILEHKGLAVGTQLKPVSPFWPAETYHQDYYHKTGKAPYCHRYQRLFDISD